MLIEHQKLSHPNVHLAASPWSEDQTLHIACMYSNPQRWTARPELFNDFRKRMETAPNIILYVGEVAFGDRPFEVTSLDNPHDFQFRTTSELWLKENVLNLVVQRMPPTAQYVGYIDGDVGMSRYDWGLEAIHQLQHYHAVQLFHQFIDTDKRQRPLGITNGFVYSYSHTIVPNIYKDLATLNSPSVTNENCYKDMTKSNSWWGATGLGWAYRKSTWDAMGGLFDVAILGSADWIMAYGLIGQNDGRDSDYENLPAYYRVTRQWQDNAAREIKANIWYIDNLITHYWHGPKANRFYRERANILEENKFDPIKDLRRDWQGLYQLSNNKPKLRDDLRHYFRARNEDDPKLAPNERLLK